jgi:hypothetical protein
VYVKLPVTTTRGEPLYEAVRALSQDGVKVNLTAIFAAEQVARGVKALAAGAPACVSVFAGRLADVGIDYRPIMRDAIARSREVSNVEIIWASTREVFNVIEADEMSCNIITVPPSLVKKLPSLGSQKCVGIVIGRSQSVPGGCGVGRAEIISQDRYRSRRLQKSALTNNLVKAVGSPYGHFFEPVAHGREDRVQGDQGIDGPLS